MINTFSLEQKSKTNNLDYNLIFCQYELNFLTRLNEIKRLHSKLRQNRIARELGCSTSTLQR